MTTYTNKKNNTVFTKMTVLSDGRVELQNEFETYTVAATTFKRWFKKEVTVDMTEVKAPEPQPEQKTTKAKKTSRNVKVDFTECDKQLTNKQAEAYQQLIKELPIWDAAKSTKSVDINLTTDDEGNLIVKSTIVTMSNEVRNREIFIGRSGGITAYGKKTHSKHVKLMRAKQDVMKYGYSVEA